MEKWTQKQKETFYRANNEDKKAIQKILRDGEFDVWVEWNEDLYCTMQAINIAFKVVDAKDKKKYLQAVEYVKAYLLSSKNHEGEMASILLIVASEREHKTMVTQNEKPASMKDVEGAERAIRKLLWRLRRLNIDPKKVLVHGKEARIEEFLGALIIPMTGCGSGRPPRKEKQNANLPRRMCALPGCS